MPHDIQDVIKALRAADASGNVEDAKRLADIANKIKQPGVASPTIEKFGFLESMGVGAEKSLAGLPIRALRETGVLGQIPKKEPQKLPEAIGRGIGEVAGFLLPMGVITKEVAAGTGLAAEIGKNILGTMVKHPWMTMATEVTGGAGMGTGEYAGEKLYPEKPAAKAIGGMAGGLAGSLLPGATAYTPTRLAVKGGRRLLQKISLPFTETGATYRAGEFLKKQVSEPLTAAKKVIEPTIGELPPVVASGEKRLIALYKDLLTKDPIADAEAIRNIGKSFQQLESEMRGLGYGTPDALKDVIQKRIASIELGMDKRVAKAMEKAQGELSFLPIARRKGDESRIVRTELENVMKAENTLVKNAWADVPKDLKVTADKTRKTFTDIMDDLSTAQRSDVPSVLRTHKLFSKKVTEEGAEEWEEIAETTLRELQGLRSKLLEQARIARSTNQWNKARISEDMADAILEDLDIAAAGTAESESGALRVALAATRKFKERFQQGIIGKILGYERQGPPAISPELTLDISVGQMGTKGALALEKVSVTPEAIAATKRYLARSFTDYAVNKKTGLVDPLKADQWVKTNEAILDKMPDMRSSLTNITKSQRLANSTLATMEARKKLLQNPKISIANRFLNTDTGKEVDIILKSNDPMRMANQLVRQAKKDPTGDSLEGLKASFSDYMLEKSAVGKYNEFGERTLSGRTLTSFIRQHESTLRQIFSSEEISRMNKIASELKNLEMLEMAGAGTEIKMEDIASNMLRLVSRVGGAQIGRVIARATGGGTVQTPGIFSERFRNVASRLTKDRAFQLISDAILSEDGKLLQSLLLPISKPGIGTTGNLKSLDQRLNLWLTSEGSRVMNDIIEEVRPSTEENILPLGIRK